MYVSRVKYEFRDMSICLALKSLSLASLFSPNCSRTSALCFHLFGFEMWPGYGGLIYEGLNDGHILAKRRTSVEPASSLDSSK
jgi:hypothetical protein